MSNKLLPSVYLYPAYGRTYSNMKELKADWEKGRDFKILHGPYTSVRDVELIKKDFQSIYVFPSKVESFYLKL